MYVGDVYSNKIVFYTYRFYVNLIDYIVKRV